MKKIIPIISIISAGVMLTGCSNAPTKLNPNELLENVSSFQNCVDDYTKNESESLSKIALGKYELAVSAPLNATLVNAEPQKDSNDNKNLDKDIKKAENNSNNEIANNVSHLDKDFKNDISNKADASSIITNQKMNNETKNSEIIENKENKNTKMITPIEKTIKNEEKNKTIENLSEDREIRKQNVDNMLNQLNNDNTKLNLSNIVENDSETKNSTINNAVNDTEINDENIESEKISTLYSLSNDIEDSCDEFCELKEDIVNAIIETQNLITKVQSKEIELTTEQKIFISEQSEQLKNLARRLSSITTELSLNLSDLTTITGNSDNDLDALSLKYLIVLDNLINGNELLENGLQSLNMINNLFDMSSKLAPNNKGRILYGFKRNNEEPIIKDYLINENGQIVENTNNSENEIEDEDKVNDSLNDTNSDETNNQNNTTNNNAQLNNTTPQNSNITQLNNTTANTETNNQIRQNKARKNNVDTYRNNNFNSNIDTYGNNFRNTDTFFNTALLDNEFMYGRGGNPYMNNYMYNNPNGMNYNNMNNYNNLNSENNTKESVNNDNTTQNMDNSDTTRKTDKTTKKKKLSKNIDTYKDSNTPTLKAKFNKFKNSVSNFFAKFSNPKKEGHYENPIHKYNKITNANDIDEIK